MPPQVPALAETTGPFEGAIELARTCHVFLGEHRPTGVAVDVSLG